MKAQTQGNWGNLINYLKSFFFSSYFSLNSTDKELLVKELQEVNYKRSKNFAFILLIVDILTLYSDRSNYLKGLWQITPGYKTLYFLHVFLAVAMLILSISSVFINKLPTGNVLRRYYGQAFALFILLFSVVVSINDQRIHGEITVFILGMYLITVNNYLKPTTSFLMYICSYITFIIGIPHFQLNLKVLRGHYINASFLIVIAWVLSIILFNLRTQEYKSRNTITRQNKVLENINKGLLDTNERLQKSLKALDESHNIIFTLVLALESKDTYTSGHSQRVAEIALKIAKYLNLDQEAQTQIWRAGILHDVGKIGIPDAVLNKIGKLNNAEWLIMQSHPARGENICSKLNFAQEILPIIRSHHERFDGKGYPDHLKGDEIPFLARIITIADTLDAITSERPYRPARSMPQALQELINGSSTQFDPYLVKTFLEMIENRTKHNNFYAN